MGGKPGAALKAGLGFSLHLSQEVALGFTFQTVDLWPSTQARS